MERNYELFRPFYDALVAITNGSTFATTTAPELQLSIIKADVAELLLCIDAEVRVNAEIAETTHSW